jgi:hypothetical protein
MINRRQWLYEREDWRNLLEVNDAARKGSSHARHVHSEGDHLWL